ncbi:uncharacterized protein BJ212DRAFT_15529 [Suillus subaureus]|uniref:Uncharacterized protein n=1 Tax=Suillus subaureus TaxID=48587 RepID=A0A9P7ENX5_9AGAM|nr:uncharacterized protein BJ212DRAFT_15529 [Suillus subaureus]KAG1826909.1 hypothetical protein BJ212DRAFT_15529 [Suillus subaureus]
MERPKETPNTPFLRDTSTHPTHTQTAHARYTYPTSPHHCDFPKPDGRCFMACTFLHSSRIHIAANPSLLRVIPRSIHFEHVTLCMIHSLIFCMAPCFICFYQFLSRLEVHLCDIYVLRKRPSTIKPITIILNSEPRPSELFENSFRSTCELFVLITRSLVLSVCSYILVSRYKQQMSLREFLLHLLAPISETRSVVHITVLGSAPQIRSSVQLVHTFSYVLLSVP